MRAVPPLIGGTERDDQPNRSPARRCGACGLAVADGVVHGLGQIDS